MLNFKSCGDGCPFRQISWIFCSNSRACHLASLPRQTKPSGLKLSQAQRNQLSQASNIIAKQSKLTKQSKAEQANQSKTSKQAKQSKQTKQVNKGNQATKQSKPSKQSKASKLVSKQANKQVK